MSNTCCWTIDLDWNYMLFMNRIIYYVAVALIGLSSMAIPSTLLAAAISGGAAIFLPFAVVYWLLNNVLLKSVFGAGGFGESATTVAKWTLLVSMLLILAGAFKNYSFISQLGVAFLFFSGEIYFTRKEEYQTKAD